MRQQTLMRPFLVLLLIAAASATWTPCGQDSQCPTAGQKCCVLGAPPAPKGGACCPPTDCVGKSTIAGYFHVCKKNGVTEDWAAFKQTFGKTYDSAEESKRFNIFISNLVYISAENAKGHNFTLGVNQFSDLTPEEFATQNTGWAKPDALFGAVPNLGNHTWDGTDLPASVDWTTKGAVTPVKNQGQCGKLLLFALLVVPPYSVTSFLSAGSCWAFSAVGALEGARQLQTSNLTSLAEQQFVDCPSKLNIPPLLGCHGGAMSGAFNFAKKHAICTEASYKYTAKGGSCESSSCDIGIPQGKVLGYKGLAPLARVIPGTEKQLMSAVAQQPVSVGIEAASSPFQHYKSGVFSGDCGSMPLGLIDHGVLLVGYGTDSAAGGDYWKIKNSWGTTWGDSGYVRLKRGGEGMYGQCHVLSSASYPVVSK